MRTAPSGVQLTVNSARQQVKNSQVSSMGGAGNAGDRGAGAFADLFGANPHNSTDMLYRWRQYVQLYETSWEARKIVRIPIEDALRKGWQAEGIPEEIAKAIQTKLDHMQFPTILSRSLMLERLLGGCLTFLGLEGNEGVTPDKEYKPRTGEALRFCNAIPVSRIARTSWDTDPLSANYMRPESFLINGQQVHVSRFLVWDGDPLFDPYDYALTNFRSNLSGFGPSKLAPVWDDIIKAVGTRQAAYQLIQTSNVMMMMINDLSDLTGTSSGAKVMAKLKEVVNQMSLYRAAILDGDTVDVKQHSASFGSVPELIITFLQVLSAASDIPATRFLGQAPGGLNATGDSDLENYYNMIDAIQKQRIVPQLRRVYDIVGYNLYKEQWGTMRDKLDLVFPPMWNATELEEADLATKQIANVMTLFEANLCDEKAAIAELNSKKVFTTALDDVDLGLMDDLNRGIDGASAEDGQPADARVELEKLKNMAVANATFRKGTEDIGKPFRWTDRQSAINAASALANREPGWSVLQLCSYIISERNETYAGDPNEISTSAWNAFKSDVSKILKVKGDYRNSTDPEFTKGMAVEREHDDITGGDPELVEKIVRAHLEEDPQYYTKLEQIENSIALAQLPSPTDKQISAGNYKKHQLRLHGLDFSVENPQGSTRRGTAADGTAWESELPAHYGYIKRTEGADGDHVDAYIGDLEDSELVFVVDQKNLDTGAFDEHKCVFGCLSMTQAKELYARGFSDGKGELRIDKITPVHVDQFKQWLATGDTKKPFAPKPKRTA